MNNRLIITLALFLCLAHSAMAQKEQRGVASIGKDAPQILAKGQWMAGGTMSYTDFRAQDYAIAVIKGINTNGYNIKVSPTVMCGLAKNLGLGANFGYKRGSFNLDQAGLEAMGATIEVKDYRTISQSFGGDVFVRYFIPLGNSQRFSIFGDLHLGADYGQSRITNNQSGAIIGTYQTKLDITAGVDFGLMARFTKHFALEAALDILGGGVSNTRQIKNQVSEGSRGHWNAFYSINLLSLRIGGYFYF